MQVILNFLQLSGPYFLPPVVGAFIGYLTNKIAIRMLFRPLKKWHVAAIPIPMTPGVIPSKRHELARNMGEVVGNHLLTEGEVAKAMEDELFQQYLLNIVTHQIDLLFDKDIASISKTIPGEYRKYYEIAVSTFKYQLAAKISTFIKSEKFEDIVQQEMDVIINHFMDKPVEQMITGQEREQIYSFLKLKFAVFFKSETLRDWIKETLLQKTYAALQNNQPLSELVPDSVIEMLGDLIRKQVPELLSKSGDIVNDPVIQKKIIDGVKKGINEFADSLGPMGGMVKNFLSPEVVEKKVSSYLLDHKDAISEAMLNEEVQTKLVSMLQIKLDDFLKQPLNILVSLEQSSNIEDTCSYIADKVAALFESEKTQETLVSMVKNQFEIYLAEEEKTIGDMTVDFLGQAKVESMKKWGAHEILAITRSAQTIKKIAEMSDYIVDELLNRPVGRLSALVPSGVKDGICRSIKRLITEHVSREIPAIMNVLRIDRIISKKIDSLDLLQLEKLLLSIMSEQFKYINLFGAFLGFLLGLINTMFLLFI